MQVTVSTLKSQGHRPDLFGEYFDRLNALYVMVALGRARKLKIKLRQSNVVQSEVIPGAEGRAASPEILSCIGPSR
jgi:hypothetical protein